MEHVSVLKKDVQKCLDLKEAEVVVDMTLGLGGHSKDILEGIGEEGVLIAFEQDERNLEEAKKRLDSYEKQIVYIHDNFRYLKNRLNEKGFEKVDAILMDLGLSSPHIEDSERGFSFKFEGPLDMRFDPRMEKTAADVVNSYEESELVRIFFEYGEEKYARKIAGKICERRKIKLFEMTTELADFIASIVGGKQKIHPATRIFQALRIEVNDELEVLKEALQQAMEVLKVSGRIVIISYHSLEDRIVKHFFKKLLQPKAEGEEKIYKTFSDPFVEAISKKAIVTSDEEVALNPRSRSAKLRAYKKLK